MSYAAVLLNHVRAVQAATRELGLSASMPMSDLSLIVEGKGRSQIWQPKFMTVLNGRLCYTDQPVEGTLAFVGWMPYKLRRWGIGTNKATFKRWASSAGVQTPAACVDPAAIGGPFLIKQENSSFGLGMRGPFLSHDSALAEHGLGPSEYYENFILGQIAKAWCWGSKCLAVVLQKPTLVVGDGERSVRELVTELPNTQAPNHDWSTLLLLSQYCGIRDLDTPVPQGKEVLVEYRYGSRYEAPNYRDTNVIGQPGYQGVVAQFDAAAAAAVDVIAPETGTPNVLYTLDAMVDSNGEVWFLEMNCNPVVHPNCYREMLAS